MFLRWWCFLEPLSTDNLLECWFLITGDDEWCMIVPKEVIEGSSSIQEGMWFVR